MEREPLLTKICAGGMNWYGMCGKTLHPNIFRGGGLSQVAMEMISRPFCITFDVTDGEGRRLLNFKKRIIYHPSQGLGRLPEAEWGSFR